MRKTVSAAVSFGIILVLITAAAYLVYAAFSGTKRNLGSNTVFNNVTIAGGVNLGSLAADGSIKMKPTTPPPKPCSANEGTLYTNSTSHIMYYCNGTSWTSL
ncbi:MAG: hypothetical protein M1120_03280 [Patescibacteria group bacterium]|nr:hypothetical protein [Patescibacteria group bacterium]